MLLQKIKTFLFIIIVLTSVDISVINAQVDCNYNANEEYENFAEGITGCDFEMTYWINSAEGCETSIYIAYPSLHLDLIKAEIYDAFNYGPIVEIEVEDTDVGTTPDWISVDRKKIISWSSPSSVVTIKLTFAGLKPINYFPDDVRIRFYEENGYEDPNDIKPIYSSFIYSPKVGYPFVLDGFQLSNQTPTITFSNSNGSNLYGSDSKTILGTLTVDLSSIIRGLEVNPQGMIRAEWVPLPTAQIIIAPNASGDPTNFELRDIDFNSYCHGPWQGFLVREGCTLTLTDVNVDNAEITVTLEQGATLNMNGSTITNSKQAILSLGGNEINIINNSLISKIDEDAIVLNESCDLNLIDSEISNANIGVNTFGENTISLLGTSFVDISSAGITADDKIIVPFFERNVFKNCQTGIDANNSYIGLDLTSSEYNENYFINCGTGISLNGPQASVKWNVFEGVGIGIDLNNSLGTIVEYNRIEYKEKGLIANNGSFWARYNQFRAELENTVGILNLFTDNTLIAENNFYSRGVAISAFFAGSTNIIDNVILGHGTYGSGGSGIFLLRTQAIVRANTIEISGNPGSGGHFGIRSVASLGNIISDNTLTTEVIMGTGIILEGQNSDIVRNNEINRFGKRGIYVDNSPNNLIECNYINTSNLGINIGVNSMNQEIITNDLFNYGFDLKLESEIGIQEFHGNLFRGNGVDGSDLTFGELQNSTFIVDNEFNEFNLPSVYNPEELFDNRRFKGAITLTCDRTSIERHKSISDPCEMLNRIVAVEHSNPAYYTVNIIHLFGMAELEFEENQCLKEYWNNNLSDNVKTLIEASDLFRNKLNSNEKHVLTSKANDFYSALSTNANLSEKREEWKSNQENLGFKFDNLVQRYKSSLNTLSAENDVETIWKKTLLFTFDYFQNGYLEEIQIGDLKIIAQLCSKNYGDPVNWARAILTILGEQYSDLNDNCGDADERDRETLERDAHVVFPAFQIAPNPTQGITKISHPVLEIESYQLFDWSGRLVAFEVVNDKKADIDLSNLPSGIYLLEAKDSQGQLSTHKISRF